MPTRLRRLLFPFSQYFSSLRSTLIPLRILPNPPLKLLRTLLATVTPGPHQRLQARQRVVAALRPRGARRVGLRGRGRQRAHIHIKGRHLRSRPLLSVPCARHFAPARPTDRAAACLAMGRQKELMNRCGEMLHIRYRLLRQALAECLGTLILVVSAGE